MTLLQDDGDGNAGSGREMTPIGATPTPPSASKSPRLLSPTGDSMSMSSRGNTLTPSMDDFGGGGASRDATLNSLNSSSGSGSRVVQIRRTYDTMDRTQSPSPSEEEPSAYLCCSKEEPDQFQIDLCPRAWFCCCESTAVEDQEACSLTAAETGEAGPRRRRTGPRPGVFTVLWRVCFVIFCLPLCYPCYLTRCVYKARVTDVIKHNWP